MPPRSVPSALRPAVREHARPAVPQPHQHQQLNTSARSPAFSSPASPHSNLSIANRHTPGLQLRRNKHFPIANMTTNTNKACCSIPPVQSSYSPKGSDERIAGLTTYVSGSKSASKAIVCVYDIFGFWPTTKQGVDILAQATGARVVMPDFFRGKPFPQEFFPPDNEEKQNALQSFFGAAGDFGKRKPELEAVAKELKANGAQKVGLYGFCWGGKLSVLAGGESTPFAAVAQVHPAMLDSSDAEKLTVPIANFPSGDEPKDGIDAFQKAVSAKPFANECEFKHYPENHHGWAAARANLDDKTNFDAFQDVYQRLADFFNKHL